MAPNPHFPPRETVPNGPDSPANPNTPVAATALRIVGGLLIAGGAIVALTAITASTDVVWLQAMWAVSMLASSVFAFGFASVTENLARIENHLRREPKRTLDESSSGTREAGNTKVEPERPKLEPIPAAPVRLRTKLVIATICLGMLLLIFFYQ